MPPIPTSPAQLLSSLQHRIHDIRAYQLPRLRSCKSSSGTGSQRELAEEVKSDLEYLRRGLEVGGSVDPPLTP